MGITSRRNLSTDGGGLAAVVSEHNKLRLDLAKLKAGTIFHVDPTVPTLPTNATDQPTLNALLNALKATLNAHDASACNATTGVGAHIAADATNTVTSPDATDLTSSETLANEIKTDLNAHLAQSGVHHTNDATNTVSAANGTDLATTITLANQEKSKLLAHLASGFASNAIVLTAP